MVGVQFENVGATETINVNDIISLKGIEPVLFDDMDKAARIDVLVGGGYESYYYLSDADDGTERYDIVGWANGGGEVIDTTDLMLGDGFWFVAPEASAGATITVAGQVTNAAEMSCDVPGGNTFAIRANPYPIAVNLANVKTSGLVPVLFDEIESAARIDVLVGGGYQSYYYISDADDGSETYDITGWANGGGDFMNEVVIEAGASFWINSKDAGSLTFSL